MPKLLGMRKYLAFLFLAFAVTACSLVHGPGPQAPSASVQKLGTDTVALVLPDLEGAHVFCTAVWVSPSRILTANHCVEGAAEALEQEPSQVQLHYVMQDEVAGFRQEPYGMHTARVLSRDPVTDLALLEAQGPVRDHTYASVGREPAQGAHLRIMGHPTGLYWSLIEGNVAAYRWNLGGPAQIQCDVMQVSAPVYFGNSGGGAFNNDGELVGIASFIMRGPDLAFFISANTIREFLSTQ